MEFYEINEVSHEGSEAFVIISGQMEFYGINDVTGELENDIQPYQVTYSIG